MLMELQIICLVSIALDTSTKSINNITSYFLYQSVCSLAIMFTYFSYLPNIFLVILFSFKLGMFPFSGWYTSSLSGLSITVLLGIYFLYMQYLEYSESAFSISDGIYGTTFFISTGFHGIHVIVGTSFLAYVLISISKGVLLHNHHFMFEAAA